MDKAARKAWLDGLKVGDKVCVESFGAIGRYIEVATIDKITPTRQFRIGSYLLNVEGERREGWNHFTIIPLTDEIKAQIHERNIRAYIKKIDFGTLGMDKVQKIYEILKEE